MIIDSHCHIIPGVDDGAKDIESALMMLKIAEEDGVDGIISTPHFIVNKYDIPYNEIKKK